MAQTTYDSARDRSDLVDAQTFRLRTQLLSEGRTHQVIASTRAEHGAMNIAIKCYAEGGENVFHAHNGEDHAFIILQGRARFHQPDGEPRELGRNEGILLPAGAFYRFESCAAEPLVMARVGNVFQPVSDAPVDPRASGRVGAGGAVLAGDSADNKHVRAVPIEGAWYE